MRYFIVMVILGLGILPSCDFGSKNINPDAKREIREKYGGKYSQKIERINNRTNVSASNNGITKKIFNLELKESDAVENYSTNLWIPASNIAYLFYTNLKDSNSVENVNVKLELKNGEFENFIYTRIELEKIKEFMPVFKILTKRISERDYQGILSNLKINLDFEKIETLCDLNDSIFGKISETEYLGFAFVKNNQSNQTFAKMTGVNLRGVKNTPFSVFINMDTQVIESFVFEF